MTDTEGAADTPVATAAPVTKLSPKDRRKRISDRVPAAAFNTFLGMSTADVADIADSFRADIASLSTSAVGNGHCYHQPQENVLVKRALMATARRKVLLEDHSKFGRQALYELAPLADFDLVISDELLPQEEQDALQSLGVRYELAVEGSRWG